MHDRSRGISATVSRTTTTDANGFYLFNSVIAGTYTILEIPPPGYVNELPVPGTGLASPGGRSGPLAASTALARLRAL